MLTVVHLEGDDGIVEINAEEVLISSGADALGLMFSVTQRDFIIHQGNVAPEFFDLSTGIAGEVVQKFVNYGRRLAIVGDYSGMASKSLNDFIYESNKTGQVVFPASVADAVKKLSG